MKADFSKIPVQELARMLHGAETDLAMLQNVAAGIAKYRADLIEELKARQEAAKKEGPTQPAAPGSN